jgi:hypothetical protein
MFNEVILLIQHLNLYRKDIMIRFHSWRFISLILALIALTLVMRLPIGQAAGVVNPCTEASLDAALAGGGTVTFACSGTINITATKVIAANTILDGSGQNVTLNGGGAVRVLYVNTGISLEIHSLTISNGIDAAGGGIYNDDGTLIVSNSTLSGNTATTGIGGGVFNIGPLTIINSTFSGNTAVNGGALTFGTVGNAVIINSTFANNSADFGGAVLNAGLLTIINSTFSGNTASGMDNFYVGSTGALTISGSIINGGTCFGTMTDGGNNIAFNAAGCPGANIDPMLGTLGNYGGATQTFSLLAGSPALDAFTAGCPATDQRGIPRPQGAACDIGAYETQVMTSPSGTPIFIIPTLPPPPQCQEMEDASFAAPVGWYCQVLMRNNAWVGYPGTIPSELTDAGVIIAVDVIYYDYPGHASQEVDGQHQVCLQGQGRFIFLSNAQSPRVIVEMNSVHESGYTCAWIDTPGTAVLIHD